MRDDWDNMVGIQGERGSGKSTLALRLALSLDPDFNVENVFYDSQDWNQIGQGPKRQTFILDEGTNIAFNRTWQQAEQIQLMQLLNTIRQRNHTLIWCAPNLERMDTVVRGDIMKYRFSTLKRGLAVLHHRVYNWDKGSATWKKLAQVSYRGLEWHPIWQSYEARKDRSFQEHISMYSGGNDDVAAITRALETGKLPT
jgi:ABC-type dipeptide/oligopeptide/nickel transport system ATPase component